MVQRTLTGKVAKKSKKKKGTGDSYINIRGSGEIRVRAKNKEEALMKARNLFEAKLRECDLWNEKNVMMNRWMGLVGLEVSKTSKVDKRKKEGVKLDSLEWQNAKKGRWIQNKKLFG